MLFVEVIGWLGAALLLLAYFLLVHKDLSRNSAVYHVMNLLATSLLGVNAYVNGAMPSFGISVVWGVIALYGLSFARNHHK